VTGDRLQPTQPLLVVEHLRTVFRLQTGHDVPAVDDVSFVIRTGETLGLVGESGSGKSVTALSIMRLVAPPGRVAAGRILFEGRDLLVASDEEMRWHRGRRIGFIFQEPMVALDPVYTVGNHIEEALAVHQLARGAAARRRVLELLDAVRIPDPARRANEYPHQLSGGLRQRVMIAVALAANPSLVIADEPTTALDATVQAEILELLREMRRMFQLSLLLITHDLGVVAEMADRVAVMYGGRVIEQAPTRTLFSTPAHPYTQALLASIPGARPGARLTSIPGSVPAIAAMPAGCAFGPRCPRRFDACIEVPPMIDVGPAHDARCHLPMSSAAGER
jgi:oligopeptide/dipeptide ABC transporter ATP-binding protein